MLNGLQKAPVHHPSVQHGLLFVSDSSWPLETFLSRAISTTWVDHLHSYSMGLSMHLLRTSQ